MIRQLGWRNLPTSALTIDLEVFEANLNKMSDYLAQHGMGLKCHAKMHKSPVIARQQLAKGAIGICCATVSEAEVMVTAGIQDIFITSPVVTAEKLKQVVRLAKLATGLQIVVDHQQGALMLHESAQSVGVQLNVLVDLDPGMGCTGISPGDQALQLVRYIIHACDHLRFQGLQMYIGNCMHVVGYEKRRDKYAHLLQKGMATKALIAAAGIAVPVFTGGGTGTFDIDTKLEVLTDLQAGSYAFVDVEFREIEGVVYHFGGDEHGIIQLNNPFREIALGDKLEIITPHYDPTVNLFDYYYPYRQGLISKIWPISARGRSQ